MQKILLSLLIFSTFALANKPALFSLKTYDANRHTNLIGWVMSEKLDGVRGFWDGKQLLTRSGKVLNPPKWFIKNYPPFAIDGELWRKRGDFDRISSIVRSTKSKQRWRQITHQIFEVPNQTGNLSQRLAVLAQYLNAHPDTPIRLIEQIPIQHKAQLAKYLKSIMDKGGEGVVVRNPQLAYQTGRLSSALKVKPYQNSECVIIAILGGKRKYLGKMGSVKCRTKTGNVVKIGSGFSDAQREHPPEIGTRIAFKYYGLTKKGKYRNSVFLKAHPK